MITVAVQGVTDTAGVAMSQPASFQFSVGGCQAALPAACALSFETFDVPKFSQTTLSKINDSGAMVGSAVDQQQLNHGFLAQDGSVTILDDPAASGLVGTLAMGLSNNGLVAGFYHTGLTASQNGTNHGFILQGSSYTNFDFGTNANTLAKGVNSAGVSVGTSSNPGICCSPSWIRAADGTFTHLEDGLLPDGLRLPTEINDNGVISGASPDGRAFLFANGAFTYFQVPGAQSSSANGLNNAEQVAGSIQVQQAGTPPSRTLGFVKTGDSFCAVEIQNATFTSANDVNAAGVVVGNYLDDKGISHGFIGRPKP